MDLSREKTARCLHQIFNRHPLSEPEQNFLNTKAFAKMLFLSACRHADALNKILDRFTHKKNTSKSFLNTILLTALTEMFYMESPDYAVINEYVNMTKKHYDKYKAPFVNAVLRNIAKQKNDLKTAYSSHFFTGSFKEILEADYSPEETARIEAASINEPPLSISVAHNPAKWAEKLKAQSLNNSIILRQAGKIENIEGYQEGLWWVQDIAATLAVPCFSTLKGKRILDLCAAPGGKTAQLIAGGALVTSLDNSEQRLQILKENLSRLKMKPQKIICADALEYLEKFSEEPFDGILLDAPCSATGVFRRHPELIYLKTKQDITRQTALQQKILHKISSALKSGGELIYCVCSISHQEGEKQILSFVKQFPDFHISPLKNIDEPLSVKPEGFIRTLPYHYATYGGCDAFFIAKLIKDTKK